MWNMQIDIRLKNVGMQYNRDWDTNSTKDRYEQQDKEKIVYCFSTLLQYSGRNLNL